MSEDKDDFDYFDIVPAVWEGDEEHPTKQFHDLDEAKAYAAEHCEPDPEKAVGWVLRGRRQQTSYERATIVGTGDEKYEVANLYRELTLNSLEGDLTDKYALFDLPGRGGFHRSLKVGNG